MIFSILNFLRGYCLIILHGANQERFLNLCVKKNILLWKVEKKKGEFTFYISGAGYRMLEEISKKTGCSYECVKKAGLPHLFYRYRKRKAFAAALLGCGIALYVLSLFVWKIEVVGSYSHSEEDILNYLKEKQICCGILSKKIDCEKLERKIREDYKDVAWVSCELKGTLFRVHIKETLDPGAKEEEKDTPCHLTAQKDGVIESIVVRSGYAKVKKGDKVKAGDILISGIVDIVDDAGETTETLCVRASGDIYAKTQLAYQDKLPLLYYEKQYTGKEKKGYKLLFGNQLWNLSRNTMDYENYDEQTLQIPVKIGESFYLPFTLYEIKQKECIVKEKTYTKEEAVNVIKNRMNLFLEEYETKGVEILKNNVRIDCDKNECVARGTITLKERLGKEREITKNELRQRDKEEESE